MKKTKTIHMDPELIQKLYVIAKKENKNFNNLVETVLQKYTDQQLLINSVSVTLPKLITEDHKIQWMAYLDGVKGIVATADTEKEAIEELMLLVKIKLTFDKGNER